MFKGPHFKNIWLRRVNVKCQDIKVSATYERHCPSQLCSVIVHWFSFLLLRVYSFPSCSCAHPWTGNVNFAHSIVSNSNTSCGKFKRFCGKAGENLGSISEADQQKEQHFFRRISNVLENLRITCLVFRAFNIFVEFFFRQHDTDRNGSVESFIRSLGNTFSGYRILHSPLKLLPNACCCGTAHVLPNILLQSR